MPRDRYQVVLAEGCDTYQIGAAFKENPNKQGKNVDVITTTSFSNASSPAAVQDFIAALLARDSASRLRPQPVSRLLDQPRLDVVRASRRCTACTASTTTRSCVPFAKTANFGKACARERRLRRPRQPVRRRRAAAGKTCTAACTDDRGCGTGYTCKAVASASTSTIYGRACAKN